ncbi:hypothetical protein OUZ56_010982 [Daphnia magna]|uniref:Uncharacterized protein n=1 Tax=Daphnia magna TaxID=35525 RepID=A0ABQ9YZ31_9CRUS|nr:hypothetical protein OUZ56_010982 [Daphnia magna]
MRGSFLMGKPTLQLRRHTVSIALLPWQLKHSKRPQNTKNQKVYQLPPLSPTYGFQLPPDQIVPTATETWNGLKAMINAI